MSKNPTISVLMAVYNTERYLAQAVESILAQTYRDFEFIIIDDGSTDSCLQILEKFAVIDLRIRLTSRENRGIPRTRNELLLQAKGEFIAVMDSDDIALPERLAHQVEFLQSNPHIVCVGGAYELIDSKSRLLTRLQPPLGNSEIQQAALAGHTSINNPCSMMRRASVIKVGGYDETMVQCEDLDLWLKLGEIGQLANLQETVLKYRLHPHSVSEKDCVFQGQKAQEACERAYQRRGIEGHFEAAEPWRPGPDCLSRYRFMLQYGWWAFNSSQRRTAAIYGIKAIVAQPYAGGGWKLLACAAIKKLPNYGSKKL